MSEEKHLENLQEIRSIMERNTRFLSLSGLSGVMAGVVALIGAGFAFSIYANEVINSTFLRMSPNWGVVQRDLIMIAAGVLVAAIGFAYFFTARKAKRAGEKVWNKTSKGILLNLLIPLATGGVLSLVLLKNDLFIWVPPITLIFYGLACIGASQKTVRDIFYLGLTCLLLGLLNTLFLGYGIIFWALGFGIAHILYGTLMYFKYDRKS